MQRKEIVHYLCIITIIFFMTFSIPAYAVEKKYQTIYDISEFSETDAIFIEEGFPFNNYYMGENYSEFSAPLYMRLPNDLLKEKVKSIFAGILPLEILDSTDRIPNGKKNILYLRFYTSQRNLPPSDREIPAVLLLQILKKTEGGLQPLTQDYIPAYPFILKRTFNDPSVNVDMVQFKKDVDLAIPLLIGFLPKYIACAQKIKGKYYCDRMFETQKYNEGTPSYIMKEIDDLKVNGKLPPATDLPY